MMAQADVTASGSEEPRHELACCEEMARIFRALGNDIRLGILRRIIEGRLCVSELQEELHRSQPNISQHLAILRDRGVVVAERDGARVCYRLADPRIADLLELAAGIFDIEHRD